MASGGATPGDVTPHTAGVAKAAGVIALGNIASRLLGMAREFVKADLFGASGLVSAFEVANIVPTMIYDLLVGGMISSALVPVLSEYSSSDRDPKEFWHLFSTLFSIASVFLAGFVVLAELLAPQIAWLFGARNFRDPELLATTTRLLRLMLPAILFLNLSGLITGALYSLKRFTLPALTGAAFNAAIVAVALIRPEHIDSLAWGVLVGSLIQVFLQLPAMEFKRLRWRWSSDPALYRIIRLYVPIVLGVVVSQIAIGISYNLATQTGDESVATMRYATTLIQFPLGLVATAVSVAILPTLAQQSARHEEQSAFNSTLAQGLNLVLVLIIPAAVGLFVLARPIVGLAFEHGDFSAAATEQTSLVLRYYLIGLPFAAVDQVLIFASYARRNTLTPALVGVLSVLVYLLVALLLIRPMGLYSLMIADSIKHMTHAGVMAFILNRQLRGIGGGIWLATGKAIVASALMGAIVWGLGLLLPAPTPLIHRLLLTGVGGLAGVLSYALIIGRLRVAEAQLIWQLLGARFRRNS